MGRPFPSWITKQMIRGIEGPNLNAYLLALEGWRRGLTLTWHDDYFVNNSDDTEIDSIGLTFSLSSKEKTHFFFGARGDKIKNKALSLGKNREKLLKMLKNMKIETPSIKVFSENAPVKDVRKSTKMIGFPMIIRWRKGEEEKSLKVDSELKFKDVLQRIKGENYKHLIIEEYVKGVYYRFYVVNKKVISVIKGIKPEISRKKTSDFVECLNEIPNHIKNTAIKAVNAIPGLGHGEIEIVISDHGQSVTNIIMTPDISTYIFPLLGKPRNIPAAVIDYYFPETQGLSKDRTQIYFDYRRIKNLLKKMIVQELRIPEAPKGRLYAKRYVVSGKVQGVGYRRWVRRQAGKKNLHGYTRNLRNGKTVVVVASHIKEDVDQFKEICRGGPLRAKVEGISEHNWNTQIKAGFEIRRTRS